MLRMAVVNVSNKKFEDAAYILAELYYVIEEAKRMTALTINEPRTPLELLDIDDLKVLVKEVTQYDILTRSLKQMDFGDRIIKGIEDLTKKNSLELVWTAIDSYRNALTLARANDTEIFCMVQTRLAKVYLKCFQDKIHKILGRNLLRDVMQLSQVLSCNRYNLDWYKDAAELLKDIQDETQKKEDEEWMNKRKEYLKEIKEEVDMIEARTSLSNEDLVKFLFDKFPPKHRDNWETLKPKDCNNWRKLLQKLVTVYHPDRIDKEKHSPQYYVLCEEITKELTRRYNNIKLYGED